GGVVDPATAEKPEHPLPLGGLFLQPIAELLQFFLPALLLVAFHRKPLAEAFQNLAWVAEEGFDVSPDHTLHILAVDALGRALLSGQPVQPAGELPAVAMVVVVGLPRRSPRPRKREAAQTTLDQSAQKEWRPTVPLGHDLVQPASRAVRRGRREAGGRIETRP